jgi:hypothetical protein
VFGKKIIISNNFFDPTNATKKGIQYSQLLNNLQERKKSMNNFVY